MSFFIKKEVNNLKKEMKRLEDRHNQTLKENTKFIQNEMVNLEESEKEFNDKWKVIRRK